MIDAQISENFRTLKMLGKYKSVRQLSETLNIDIRDVRKVINGNTRNSRNRTVFEAILQKLGVSQTEFSQMRAAVTHPISSLPMKSNTLQPVPDLGPIASIEDIPVSDSNRTFVCKMEAGTLQPFILPGDILYFERKELQIFPLPAPVPTMMDRVDRVNGRIVAFIQDGRVSIRLLRMIMPMKESFTIKLQSLNYPQFDGLIPESCSLRIFGVLSRIERGTCYVPEHLQREVRPF